MSHKYVIRILSFSFQVFSTGAKETWDYPQFYKLLITNIFFRVLYLRGKIAIELRLELNQMSSSRTSQSNQSISRSIDHSIKQSNWLMAMHRLWCWAKKHVGLIRPTGNTCKQILSYMTRFMLQSVSVVSSIQVEAVSLTHYFLFYEKWLWFLRHFFEGCFVAKEIVLEMWTWSWILAII